MWYVIQVSTGKEDSAVSKVRQMLPGGTIQECFNPCYLVNKKFHGEWKQVRKSLFPGCVIVDCQEPTAAAAWLKGVEGVMRMLGNGDCPVPLARVESDWIARFTTVENRVIGTSSGVIEGDRIVVQEGPLVGLESNIKKIDRHKRTAYVEFDLCGRTVTVALGLSIVRKTAAPATAKAVNV